MSWFITAPSKSGPIKGSNKGSLKDDNYIICLYLVDAITELFTNRSIVF